MTLEKGATLHDIILLAYLPALKLIGLRDSARARVMMLAIGLQESLFEHRRQMGNGPAKGFWQFERGGGVRGVLQHTASREMALQLCFARNVEPVASLVWHALEHDDVLAAGFARLLLYTDPAPLPRVDDEKAAWDYYLRNWRPGKPHPKTWPKYHQLARGFVAESADV